MVAQRAEFADVEQLPVRTPTRRRKTLKREISLLMLLFWIVLTSYVFFSAELDRIKVLDAAYSVATLSIWLFVAQAFGMDWYSQQFRGPPVRRPVGPPAPEDEDPGEFEQRNRGGSGEFAIPPADRPKV